MLHWIQYIKGYVSIKVWGYSTERFLNLCGNHDILVWDIENHGDYYTMKVRKIQKACMKRHFLVDFGLKRNQEKFREKFAE